jgi:heme exporter protein CcmD
MSEMHILSGRYALYILPAYGLTLLTFAALIIAGWLRARHWRRAAEASASASTKGQD